MRHPGRVAATGCALFATGSDALTLTVARGMIGHGFAGRLINGFKVTVIWALEPRRAPMPPGARRQDGRRLFESILATLH